VKDVLTLYLIQATLCGSSNTVAKAVKKFIVRKWFLSKIS